MNSFFFFVSWGVVVWVVCCVGCVLCGLCVVWVVVVWVVCDLLAVYWKYTDRNACFVY